VPNRRDAARHHPDEETRMTKHIESIVPRLPVRDADRSPVTQVVERSSGPRRVGPLVPVYEIPGLGPDERIAELRLRVRSGVYGEPSVVEQVAAAVRGSGF
jgi:hypothetical protein